MKLSVWAKIWRLHQRDHLSGAAIARRLRCSHRTVAKALCCEQPPTQSPKPRRNILDPYRPQIDSLIARDPDLYVHEVIEEISKGQEGYRGSVYPVRRYLQGIRQAHRKRARSELKTWLFDIVVSERTLRSVRGEIGATANLACILDVARNGTPNNRIRALAVLGRAKGFSQRMVAACLNVNP